MEWWEQVRAGARQVKPCPGLIPKILKPHRQAERTWYRCDCGGLTASDDPDWITAQHEGHLLRIAQKGSVWEWLKMRHRWLYLASTRMALWLGL